MELHGEAAKFVEQAEDAVIAVSNYRLHIKFKESLVNVSGLGWACAWVRCGRIPVHLDGVSSCFSIRL